MAFVTTPFSQTYDLSSQGTLTLGTCLLGGFKSGTLHLEGETVENYSRDDDGWTKPVPTRRSGTLSVTYLKLEDDECQVGLRAHSVSSNFLTDYIPVVYRSEKKETAPGTGFKGNFVMTSYQEEQTDGGDAVECSVEFALFGALESDVAAAGSSSSGSGTGN